MQKLKSFLKIYMLPILTGILSATTYIPFYPWALAFCLVPLWLFMWKNKDSWKRLFIGTWLTQFTFNLIGFHWIANTAIEFGEFPRPLGYIILILFACIGHLYYPVAAVLWGFCAKHCRTRVAYLMIPFTLAVTESFFPSIFNWHFGYAWLYVNLPGAHIAEWVGFYGLQLITLAINLSLFYFVKDKRKSGLVYALALFIVVNGTGYYLKHRFQEGDKTLKVLAIQANIGNAIKVEQDRGAYFHEYILREFLELTAEGLKKHPDTQLIMWPETAYPARVRLGKNIDSLQARLRYSINSFQLPLLTGAYEEDDQKEVYNSLVLFDKNGELTGTYRKTMLLAFGEYFPGSKYLPQLKTWFPMVSDFGRGTGPKVLPMKEPELIIGPQICYESLFDDETRDLFVQKANIIFNVTNDSWFGKAFEPYQHLYMTLGRAIEFRIPVVRSTNTGITTAISAGGVIAQQSPIHEKWVGAFTVRYKSHLEPTVYSHFAGQWPWILLVLFLGVLMGERIVKSRKS